MVFVPVADGRRAGSPREKPCAGQAPSVNRAATSARERRGAASVRTGAACCEQAGEEGVTAVKGGELGHVADALAEGYRGGPASEQGQKPLRRLAARVVAVEGEEDAGAAPQGAPAPRPGCPGPASPTRKGDPVEDALGDDRPQRRGAETPKAQHRLGAGQGPGNGEYGPDRRPGLRASGRRRRRRRERRPSRRTAPSPAP